MSAVLNSDQRRHLDGAVQRARTAAEQAASDALRAFAVGEPSRPGYLGDTDNALRLALREKARQLGDNTASGGADLTNLMREVAYEQWHRLLFARFLEVNGLLRHPEFRDTSLTFDDCSDLADDSDEPDGWSVAARFAAEILPGVFRLDDPAVRVRFATEHRLELEGILLSIPSEVFKTEDALGWVYQFWQTAEDKRVRHAGVKIGGSELPPVTQRFTENYMVRFLLENSLGAWWAGRHPDSPLIAGWDYLRRLDDGAPAAGTFDRWPATAAELTVMDPCCGSGHFLVAMFGMLWRMRAEEEGLSASEAQDAVLRENLHGLELDPRCTQIATFNVALEAWKQGGFRHLPAPQIACSGTPARGTRVEWEAFAGDDADLGKVLAKLHGLFRDADSLGSLIAPDLSDVGDALFGSDLNIGTTWESIRSALFPLLRAESPENSVMGHRADDVMIAAELLAGTYCLVATNVPFLGKSKAELSLLESAPFRAANGKEDLSTVMMERCLKFVSGHGSVAVVSPVYWQQIVTFRAFRRWLLQSAELPLVAQLGPGAFAEITGEVVQPTLTVLSPRTSDEDRMCFVRVGAEGPAEYARELKAAPLEIATSRSVKANPDSRIAAPSGREFPLLSLYARAWQGIKTGDNEYFVRRHWELPRIDRWWLRMVTSPNETGLLAGRSLIVRDGRGDEAKIWARVQGLDAWGGRGVAVSSVGRFRSTYYEGEAFDSSPTILVPLDPRDLEAVWAFAVSGDLEMEVRKIDSKTAVTTATMTKVPFDVDHWRAVADEQGPLPRADTQDPTQWPFRGEVRKSDYPLQVAAARLLGYRWPNQRTGDLDRFADADGIAALQSLPGEPDVATRLREFLAAAYGSAWSSSLERTLVTEAAGKDGRLEDWLRDAFFAQHVKVFDNRPFLWHIWDGRKDGFSAVVNYHRLDHKALEKLTFTSLGAWIERQRHEAAAGGAGADARLAAAETLQVKLKLILDGAPPYDVYVRWKELHEQPIGWNPDLDDGVRLNIRPFMEAGVLRSRVNVHWKKDRGMNADGSERHNDLHPTLEERREARRLSGGAA